MTSKSKKTNEKEVKIIDENPPKKDSFIKTFL